MTEPDSQLDREMHRRLAVELFNSTWDLLEMNDRTPRQDEEMVHMAHTSRYHWGVVGTVKNRARGEWQIARVYAALGRYPSSLLHASLYFDACKQHDFGPFDLAFAYEGLARAQVSEQPQKAEAYIEHGRLIGKEIVGADDREWLFNNLDEVAAMIHGG